MENDNSGMWSFGWGHKKCTLNAESIKGGSIKSESHYIWRWWLLSWSQNSLYYMKITGYLQKLTTRSYPQLVQYSPYSFTCSRWPLVSASHLFLRLLSCFSFQAMFQIKIVQLFLTSHPCHIITQVSTNSLWEELSGPHNEAHAILQGLHGLQKEVLILAVSRVGIVYMILQNHNQFTAK
jgi:hypothetical protein